MEPHTSAIFVVSPRFVMVSYVNDAQLGEGLEQALRYLDQVHEQGYTGIVVDNLANLVSFERARAAVLVVRQVRSWSPRDRAMYLADAGVAAVGHYRLLPHRR
jgi:hypothetical protein